MKLDGDGDDAMNQNSAGRDFRDFAYETVLLSTKLLVMVLFLLGGDGISADIEERRITSS